MRAKTARKKKQRRLIFGEAAEVAYALRWEPPADIDTEGLGSTLDVMEWILRRTTFLLTWAMTETDRIKMDEPGRRSATKLSGFWMEKLDNNFNVVVEPHPAFQLEQLLRQEVFNYAERMEKLDIEGRRAAVEEAQTAIFGRALQDACAEIGLNREQQQELGAALRRVLEGNLKKLGDPTMLPPGDVEGSVEEEAPAS